MIDETTGAYDKHKLQVVSKLYGWTIGLNGAGLLVCYAFIISEYQIIFNDCFSTHIASHTIRITSYYSLFFLIGLLSSGFGIVFSDISLGSHINFIREGSNFIGQDNTNLEHISLDRFRRLFRDVFYIWFLSISLFFMGLFLSYDAIFSVNPFSVEGMIQVYADECPKKPSTSVPPTAQSP